jgi:hypothetical protein
MDNTEVRPRQAVGDLRREGQGIPLWYAAVEDRLCERSPIGGIP